jgi:hypothetical protein
MALDIWTGTGTAKSKKGRVRCTNTDPDMDTNTYTDMDTDVGMEKDTDMNMDKALDIAIDMAMDIDRNSDKGRESVKKCTSNIIDQGTCVWTIQGTEGRVPNR